MNKEEWLKKGYVDEPVDEFTDLKKEIDKLRKEKKRLFLANSCIDIFIENWYT